MNRSADWLVAGIIAVGAVMLATRDPSEPDEIPFSERVFVVQSGGERWEGTVSELESSGVTLPERAVSLELLHSVLFMGQHVRRVK